jgi:NSS family neurotransmitter:Na+ symporter
MAESGREQWASHSGFVLATIGSAVGLGNIWRFAYVAGENGGGIFLLVYLVSVALVGAPLVLAELALGRRAQADAVTAFARIVPATRWQAAGWLGVIAGFVILSYYTVIAGWALKYFAGAALGALWHEASGGFGAYFREFISHPAEPVAWQTAMLGAGMVIALGGVQRGIEAANRVLMPLLALIVLGLAIYSVAQPGSGAGVRFLLAPDWPALARKEVYLAALGQAFFSLGVGMAVYVTYGGYVPAGRRLTFSVVAIISGDTLFALTAGLAIFPAVFAMGADPAAGPELAFITLPQVFLGIPGGRVVGIVFFALLVAAALTSIVALIEVATAALIARTRMGRWGAVTAVGAGAFALGLPSALSYGVLSEVRIAGLPVLDAMDTLASNVLLPLGGMAIALFVGWRWRGREVLTAAGFGPGWPGRAWLWLLRLVVPTVIAVILLRAAGGH